MEKMANVTGLWKKEKKNGGVFYTGPTMTLAALKEQLAEAVKYGEATNDSLVQFIIFPVKEKKSDKSPDINIVLAPVKPWEGKK
jgi:hypothetical protein